MAERVISVPPSTSPFSRYCRLLKTAPDMNRRPADLPAVSISYDRLTRVPHRCTVVRSAEIAELAAARPRFDLHRRGAPSWLTLAGPISSSSGFEGVLERRTDMDFLREGERQIVDGRGQCGHHSSSRSGALFGAL